MERERKTQGEILGVDARMLLREQCREGKAAGALLKSGCAWKWEF